MIIVQEMRNINSEKKEAQVNLFSDTKGEVVSEAEIVGMLPDYKPSFGSSIMTAAGELGYMKSNGQWHWV